MPNVVCQGQITLVDLNDAKSLSAHLNSSQPKIQIYNPNDGSYTPHWPTNNPVLTPELYVSGTSANIITEAKSITWYEAGNPTPLVNNTDYAIGATNPKALTIKTNKLASLYQISYICEIVWTDPSVNHDIKVIAEIEFAKVSSGEKGDTGNQGIQGPPGSNGQTYYTWLKYADSPTTGMSDSPTGKKYMGIAVNKTVQTESTNYADYTWSLIEGPQGNQGIQGPAGADGNPTYTWVKYADNASGGGMSDSPTNKTYIGFAYNKTTQTESSTPGDYLWSLIKGADGAPGADAITAYVWTPEGNVVRNGTGSLTAQADLYKGSTKQTSGITYQWYKFVTGAWQVLNGTTNYGTTGYTTATLTIPAGAIDSNSSFKCVMTYSSKAYEDVVTVIDQTDPIQAHVYALEGNTFKNGQGTKNITVKLYRLGLEVDADGSAHDYKWFLRDEDGNIDPNFGGAGVNHKLGKAITVPATQITNIGNLVLEVWTKN